MATTPIKKTAAAKKSTTKTATTKTATTKDSATGSTNETNSDASSTSNANTTSNVSTTGNAKTATDIVELQNEVNNLRQEIMMMKETLTGGGGSETSRITKLEFQLNGLGKALRNSILRKSQVSKTWKLHGFLDDLGL